MASVYDRLYEQSLRDPEAFWAAAAEDVVWDRRWDRVLDDARPPYYRWFAGGMLNTCANALDVHVERRQPAARRLEDDLERRRGADELFRSGDRDRRTGGETGAKVDSGRDQQQQNDNDAELAHPVILVLVSRPDRTRRPARTSVELSA